MQSNRGSEFIREEASPIGEPLQTSLSLGSLNVFQLHDITSQLCPPPSISIFFRPIREPVTEFVI
jgi:hypothetical protein